MDRPGNKNLSTSAPLGLLFLVTILLFTTAGQADSDKQTHETYRTPGKHYYYPNHYFSPYNYQSSGDFAERPMVIPPTVPVFNQPAYFHMTGPAARRATPQPNYYQGFAPVAPHYNPYQRGPLSYLGTQGYPQASRVPHYPQQYGVPHYPQQYGAPHYPQQPRAPQYPQHSMAPQYPQHSMVPQHPQAMAPQRYPAMNSAQPQPMMPQAQNQPQQHQAMALNSPQRETEQQTFSLHVGSFLVYSKADEVEQKLKELGVESYRQEVTKEGIRYLQLHAGPFPSKEVMKQASQLLESNQIKNRVVVR
ncbi:MAG: hypothetical protein HQL72_03005 [Magnetococcales bacterium]|nr:hypothetical protein [Magnetococcales bacterium]